MADEEESSRKLDPKAEAHAVARMSAEVSLDALGTLPKILKIIDTFDRPGKTSVAGTYAESGTYADGGEDKTMKRLPKAGVYAGAGVGRANAEWSIFEARAKGPNASAGADASVASLGATASAKAEVGSASASAGHIIGVEAKAPSVGAEVGASLPFLGAFVKAELASVSASVGPVKAKAGLAADTGVSLGVEGLKVKLLGTGITVGPEPSISLFGSELKCNIM